jgi:hypothetical protein
VKLHDAPESTNAVAGIHWFTSMGTCNNGDILYDGVDKGADVLGISESMLFNIGRVWCLFGGSGGSSGIGGNGITGGFISGRSGGFGGIGCEIGLN